MNRIEYELLRENKSLILTLKESEDEVLRLKIEIKRDKENEIELVLGLENANKEISRLQVKLVDSEKEIGSIKALLNN